jgi:hypothetical protein
MSEVLSVERRIEYCIILLMTLHHPMRKYAGLQNVLANGPAFLCWGLCVNDIPIRTSMPSQKKLSCHETQLVLI